MPLISATTNHATEMKALIEQRDSLPVSAFICFFVAGQGVKLPG